MVGYGFFTIIFYKGRIEIFGLGFGTGLEKGLVFVVIVRELSAEIFFTR